MTNALMLNQWFIGLLRGHRPEPKPPRSSGFTLTAAARALGVTREHLSRVIHGHRPSRSLTRRYTVLADAHQTTKLTNDNQR